MLAAKIFPGCEVTLGSDKEEDGKWPFAGACGGAEAMGAKHVVKNVTVSLISWSLHGAVFLKRLYVDCHKCRGLMINLPLFFQLPSYITQSQKSISFLQLIIIL